MKKQDSLGRATFHYIAPHPVSSITEREEVWLRHIMRHGAQSTLYLHELTSDTHKCEQTSRIQLRKLRKGGFIQLPPQQRATANANNNRWVWELAPKAIEYLKVRGLWEDCIRPHGHWTHAYMTSCITSSIDIEAHKIGAEYMPGHLVLERAGVPLEANIRGKKLIPDQLFGLDYGGKYRFFCVEADRGTEPSISKSKRKSHKRSIEEYIDFIGGEMYKDIWQLKARMYLLYVFNSQAKERAFLRQVESIIGECSYILTQTVSGFDYFFRPPPVYKQLYHKGWQRAGFDDFHIGRV